MQLMAIREFRFEDEEQIVKLWHDCKLVVPWNDPHEDIARKVEAQPELFLVAVIDEIVVGTVMIGYDGHRGWINYLAVSPNNQREGIGSRLMDRTEEELRRLNCPKINLQVRATNLDVIEFYEKHGFLVEEVLNMGKRL